MSSFWSVVFFYILNFSATLMKQATLEQFGISKSFDNATKKRQLQEYLTVLELLDPKNPKTQMKKPLKLRVMQ